MLWIGRIAALLCTTADTWSHEMVPCPFLSLVPTRSSCMHAWCCVFRKELAVVRGSCLREWRKSSENIMFSKKLGKSPSESFQMIKQKKSRENIMFFQKLGKSPSEPFQMIKQVYCQRALAVVLCLSGTGERQSPR
jgi:hypothetical protein